VKRAATRVIAIVIGLALAIVAVLSFLTIRFGPRAVSQVFAVDPHPEQEYSSSAVAQEIASLGATHAWAGKYFRGNGFTGEVVCIAPQSGFVRWHSWDAGPPFASSAEHGRVDESGGVLHLTPPSPPDPDEAYRPSNDFIPVSWGARHYLIPPGEAGSFCRAIAANAEPRASPIGRWLLRKGDENLPVESGAVLRPADLCR